MSEVKCYNCQKLGHLTKHCTEPKAAAAKRVTVVPAKTAGPTREAAVKSAPPSGCIRLAGNGDFVLEQRFTFDSGAQINALDAKAAKILIDGHAAKRLRLK